MKQSSDTIQKKDNLAGTAGSVQSVSRALDLLEAFPGYGPEIGLTDIASLLGLDKATAYRLLATLEKRGYIERSVGSRRYRLGLRAFVLGAYFQNHLEVRRVGLPYLHEIVQKTHEDAFLCIREGDDALCIERVEAENLVTIFSLRVGENNPCTAVQRPGLF